MKGISITSNITSKLIYFEGTETIYSFLPSYIKMYIYTWIYVYILINSNVYVCVHTYIQYMHIYLYVYILIYVYTNRYKVSWEIRNICIENNSQIPFSQKNTTCWTVKNIHSFWNLWNWNLSSLSVCRECGITY